MSQERKIIYAVALIVLSVMLYFRYGSQESEVAEQQVKSVNVEESQVTQEDDDRVQKREEETNRETVEPVTAQNDDALPAETEALANAEAEEEADEEAPTVERSKLIGGANVEWEEPKPKDPNDPFGKPPL